MIAMNLVGDLLYALYLVGIMFCLLCAANLPALISSYDRVKKTKKKVGKHQFKKKKKR